MFRLLIGGPARCGKTTAANLLAAQNSAYSLIGVDALLPAILRRPLLNSLRPRREMVAHFLTRPRYQDDDRQVTESVLDYSDLPLDALLDEAKPARSDRPVTAYSRAFDVIAKTRHSKGWIAFDVHPELRFRQLNRLIPGLHMLLVFRDPSEAIAAQIYWRQPSNHRHSAPRFRRAFLLWALAARAAIRLKVRYPDHVTTVSLPDLLRPGHESQVFGLTLRGGISTTALDSLHFQRIAGGYRLPDGTVRQLLSASEEAAIEAILAPMARQLGVTTAKPDSGIAVRDHNSLAIQLALADALAQVAPGLALSAMDFADNPAASLRQHAGNCRDILDALIRRPGNSTVL